MKNSKINNEYFIVNKMRIHYFFSKTNNIQDFLEKCLVNFKITENNNSISEGSIKVFTEFLGYSFDKQCKRIKLAIMLFSKFDSVFKLNVSLRRYMLGFQMMILSMLQ